MINLLSKTDDFIKNHKFALCKTDDFLQMRISFSKTDDFTKTHQFL